MNTIGTDTYSGTSAIYCNTERSGVEKPAEAAKTAVKSPNTDRAEFSSEAPARAEKNPPFGTYVRELTEEEKAYFAPKESTVFTCGEVSDTAKALSAKMDENDGMMRLLMSAGMSEAQLAEHFGKIGRDIDESFSKGEISEQEYKDLNKGLETYTENMTVKAERSAASWEVVKERYRSRLQAMINGTYVPETRSVEEIGKEIDEQVSAFVKNFCSIDRGPLAEMIKRVRAGAELFPKGTVHTYTRTNTAGYFKNGYVPFLPVM